MIDRNRSFVAMRSDYISKKDKTLILRKHLNGFSDLLEDIRKCDFVSQTDFLTSYVQCATISKLQKKKMLFEFYSSWTRS